MQLTSLSLALTRAGFLTFSPASLFTAGEQGVWYDPSDMSTMFQDAAGTTPVTAVEQPVGRILDKSGRGNHATQTTATSRPVLSARVNLLTKTEQFDDAAWVAARATITANNTTAPDGTLTADRITETTDFGTHRVFQPVSFQPNTTYTASVCFKKGTRRWAWLLFQNDSTPATQSMQFFDLDTGLLGSNNTGAGGTQASRVSAAMSPLGDGWYRCSLTVAFGATVTIGAFTGVYIGISNADNVNSYTGSTSDYNWIWGADLRATNMGIGLPAYQRVNTATDYDTAGFPHYLRFDGVDDWLVTPTITPGTDKAQMFAGVRKLSDAAGNVIAELSPNSSTNSGVFAITCPSALGIGDYRFRSKGTLDGVVDSPAAYLAPLTNIVTGLGDIAGDQSILRVNSIQAAISTADQGTGNYLAYPLYIGRRGGTTLPFNGHLYGLIVRFGANLPAGTIASTETWLNQRTRAYA